jgi:hypothetical protein
MAPGETLREGRKGRRTLRAWLRKPRTNGGGKDVRGDEGGTGAFEAT